jgi:hypothetical protein
MLRVERAAGAVTLVSRLARAPAVGVLAGVLLAAAAALRASPPAAAALAVGAALVVLLGGRTMRTRFARGRVHVRRGLPFRRDERALAEFSAARVETIADFRRRKAERLARRYRERSGGAEMPSWLSPPHSPGSNDHLRRLVLVAPTGEAFEVTAWLGDEDLEAVRAEVEALLR